MKYQPLPWMLVLAACAGALHSHLDATAAAPESGKPPAQPAQVIDLARQTLVFKPTRDDITVGCAIFSMYHSKPDAIRINGVRPESSRIHLKQTAKNEFELPAMKIEFAGDENGEPLYVTIKVWFNELTNQYDSPYYANIPDRYALLSWCTNPNDDPSKTNARMGANRVATLTAFKEALARPFVIKLNQRPLREEWGRYPMLPPGNRLSADELKAVEQAVGDKGEKFLINISVTDADHANVIVGEDTFFREVRSYTVVRSDGAWRVSGVERIKERW